MIYKHQAIWSGYLGGPGYTTMYGSDDTSAQVFADAVKQFIDSALTHLSIGEFLPLPVRITQNPWVDVIDPLSGNQVGQTAITPGATLVGAGSGNWSAATGACVTWQTMGFASGRRVRGRTYLVPLSGVALATDGTLGANFLTAVRAATAAYVASPATPVVFSPTRLGFTAITSGTVQDKAAILTSRRD